MTTATTNLNYKHLDYTSDSVEFYPNQNNLFVCGTYEIEKGDTEYKERRKGKLYLFEIEEPSQGNEELPNFKETQSINYNSGILDMKWNKSGEQLGVVMSRGELNIYNFKQQEKQLELLKSSEISLDSGILSLSLDWNVSGSKVIVSFSDGKVGIFDVNSLDNAISRWKAHDYEAWICAFNYHNESIVFSGGDDCKFKIWDTRIAVEENDNAPMNTITKKCDMGVTSIHCHPSMENIVAVGSYDECLRIWDLRSMRQPLVQTDSLGGGVWRVKWHPYNKNQLVTACMGGGFHVLESESENDFSTLQVINSYEGPHKSIAYGVDWSYNKNNDKQHIGCCSFYDKCLSIWNP
ncbi:hypothetical protein DICPUDRAFT_75478 [Dictyostelium purpureum]|uniref:methylated diphthine methylhydrolase n=1 Tax=Dictyostelium purpureum TaxID=5786 RepID=F0ZAS1_DICPU|nr:uncharacterized protein DICPUDRAFT_75478 [Dictyostelium purpureum]EGC38971.1 hypothetical protein DICPUDRAFT_75478 [Dictyostelium purpureum]|eukprot:XP_003284536.1 hypothetical protein DICPUDRAFT_75478 [Dictyostelium purpureum]